MCTYSAAVFDQGFDHGFDNGQDQVLNLWFKKKLAFLLKQKREGKLQETVWQFVESTCPKKELMPKLQKAVAES